MLRRTSLDAIVHWEQAEIRIPVDPALEARFGTGVRRALADAAEAWDLGGQVPKVELVHEVSEQDRLHAFEETANWVGFAASWSFGDKLAVTVSTFEVDTGALLAVQVWLNPNRTFELVAEGRAPVGRDTYDLQAVLTHELGHVLGLGEAAQVPEATMFPIIHRGETRQRRLSEADEDAVDELYAHTFLSKVAHAQCSSAAPLAGPFASRSIMLAGAVVFALRRGTRRSRLWPSTAG